MLTTKSSVVRTKFLPTFFALGMLAASARALLAVPGFIAFLNQQILGDESADATTGPATPATVPLSVVIIIISALLNILVAIPPIYFQFLEKIKKSPSEERLAHINDIVLSKPSKVAFAVGRGACLVALGFVGLTAYFTGVKLENFFGSLDATASPVNATFPSNSTFNGYPLNSTYPPVTPSPVDYASLLWIGGQVAGIYTLACSLIRNLSYNQIKIVCNLKTILSFIDRRDFSFDRKGLAKAFGISLAAMISTPFLSNFSTKGALSELPFNLPQELITLLSYVSSASSFIYLLLTSVFAAYNLMKKNQTPDTGATKYKKLRFETHYLASTFAIGLLNLLATAMLTFVSIDSTIKNEIKDHHKYALLFILGAGFAAISFASIDFFFSVVEGAKFVVERWNEKYGERLVSSPEDTTTLPEEFYERDDGTNNDSQKESQIQAVQTATDKTPLLASKTSRDGMFGSTRTTVSSQAINDDEIFSEEKSRCAMM